MAFNKNQKTVVLHDNPPIPGKKFFLCSMISPESRQKHKTYAFKLHDMCEDEEEAKRLQQYYHSLDDDFDILVGTTGKWCPWIFNTDDIPNIQYADDQLTELVGSTRRTRRVEDQAFHNRVDKHREGIENTTSKEAQEEIKNKLKETSVQMLYRIKQLELVITRRTEELNSIKELFNESYSEEERRDAELNEFPLTEPQLMYYENLDNKEIDSVPDKVESNTKKRTLSEIKQDILNNM